MQVWDAEGSGEIRFHADQAGVPVLGHIVENDVTQAALETRLAALPNVRCEAEARVVVLEEAQWGHQPRRELLLEDGRRLSAPLMVAADGARSPLRERAGIETLSHGDRACRRGYHRASWAYPWRRGPPGIPRHGSPGLPAAVHRGRNDHCSIVWSTSPDEASRLTRLSPEALGEELAAAIDHRLGEVTPIDSAVSVALTQRHARDYVQPGLALVGDAAHSIHPLAGQGVNLGLMDVAVLAEELLAARERGVSMGNERILSRYARRRRGDNASMLMLMDAFRLLFGSRQPALTLARNLGLAGIDRLTPLKRLMMRQAIGERGRLPVSCR